MVANPIPDSVEQPTHAASRYSRELDLAVELAHLAGRLQLDRYERLERIDAKGARDVVTEVDFESEDLILGGIRARFPDDALLAEESGAHPSGLIAPAGGPRTWIVDPLDGTVNYANGIPFYCVSIALAVDGRPAVGVVHDPSRDETFSATADGPALLDGRPVHVGTKEALADLVVTMAVGGRGMTARRRRLLRSVRASRSMGAAALTLCYVANGRFDAYGQGAGLSGWDVAAAGLIAERAGCLVTDLDGGPWFDLGRPARKWSLLAAAPAHHRRLLELLHGAPAEPAPTREPDAD